MKKLRKEKRRKMDEELWVMKIEEVIFLIVFIQREVTIQRCYITADSIMDE